MQNKSSHTILTLISLICVGVVVCGFLCYFKNVKSSLWTQSLSTISDTTARGAESFSFYLHRQQEALATGGASIAQFSSSDIARIQKKLNAPSSSSELTCVLILEDGTVLTPKQKFQLTKEQLADLSAFSDSGLISPNYEELLEKNVLAEYVRISMLDGKTGFFVRCYNADSLYSHFALSFFNGAGHSYIVNSAGDILMGAGAVSETGDNVFECMDAKACAPEQMQLFTDALARQQSGVSLLRQSDGSDAVYCYSPLKIDSGWMVMSIVPQETITLQSDQILQQTLILCVGLTAAFVVIVLFYLRTSRNYRLKIIRLAYRDPLTGLRNFTKFKMDCERLMRSRENSLFSVFYLDIRNFKMVNDLFGYKAGDSVLQALANTLTTEAGSDSIVGRMSADKFVLLCPYESRDWLLEFSTRLLTAANNCSPITEEHNRIEVYAGICCVEDCDAKADINALLDRANIAQRSVKYEPKEKYCFYSEVMRSKLLKEQEIELRMESALESGEFVVYIQPKYAASDGIMAGGEALVRWISPSGGMLPPNDFIPLFEKNRFIVRLDRYIFTQVCKLLRKWIDEGLNPLPISVNVSRVLLYKPDFLATYREIKEIHQIPDGMLELEFTEGLLIEDLSVLQDLTQKLKAAGFLCSIDDFGAGYSSLNVLKDLPVDVLKLDGLFFREGGNPDRDHIVIKNIVNMAKELQIKTVSEGVERWDQVDFLRQIGCDLIQGYIYAKPMPVDSYVKLLENAKAYHQI